MITRTQALEAWNAIHVNDPVDEDPYQYAVWLSCCVDDDPHCIDWDKVSELAPEPHKSWMMTLHQYVMEGKSIHELDDEEEQVKPLYFIAFSGHRPPKVGGYHSNPLRNKVKQTMLETVNRAIVKFGETHQIVIIWGGALGVDQWAAQLANHLNLSHVAMLPFAGFDNRWEWESQEILKGLLETTDPTIVRYLLDGPQDWFHHADEHSIYICDQFSIQAYQKRNEAMVDKADSLIAVWDGSSGGTANCVAYARSVDKPMVRIDPRLL